MSHFHDINRYFVKSSFLSFSLLLVIILLNIPHIHTYIFLTIDTWMCMCMQNDCEDAACSQKNKCQQFAKLSTTCSSNLNFSLHFSLAHCVLKEWEGKEKQTVQWRGKVTNSNVELLWKKWFIFNLWLSSHSPFLYVFIPPSFTLLNWKLYDVAFHLILF